MNKSQKQIAERQARAREKRMGEFAKRRARGEDGDSKGAPDMTLLAALEAAEARDAGIPIEQWRGLSEHERIRLTEEFEDRRFAGEQCLEDYRAQKRKRIENGELRKEYGFPQWLRDEYSRERPAEIVVEYLNLLREGATLSGEALQEILRKIDARTGAGFVGLNLSFPEAKARLLEEIGRVGLADLFAVAVAETMKKGGTIQ
jgi:hypothetical protein